MRELPCDRENRLRRPLMKLVELLDLEAPEGMGVLAAPNIRPVVDIFATAAAGASGDATTTAPLVLPDVRGADVVVQADPANVDDVLIGIFGFAAPHTLAPGASVSAAVASLSVITIASAGAGAVRVTWTVRGVD